MAGRVCGIEDCERRHYGRGYCAMHYRRWSIHGDPLVTLKVASTPPVVPAEERFRARVRVNADTGCWEWTGRKSTDGYGSFIVDGQFWLTHRWSYEHHVGPIPPGLHVDHLCRNTSCCNPEHLEPVTCRENVLRGIGHSAQNARKTHCPQNHPLTGDNLRMEGKRRVCRRCRAEQRAAKKA